MAEPTTWQEIERTYAVEPGVALPDLADLPGVAETGPVRVTALDATYWDTPDLRLAARGVRLRRRSGGKDAGWHLKLPVGDAVTEVQLPAGRSAGVVPRPLSSLVTALCRGEALGPVARIRTRRTEVDLLDGGGAVLATVADDDVTGQTLGADAELLRWREIEVELGASPDGSAPAGAGAHALLDAVEDRLLAAGAEPAEHPSKVGRVLGPAVPDPWPAADPADRDGPAGAVVTAYLREQADALLAQDPRVRQDLPDSVHKMRVATRRTRAALRTFRPLLDRAVTDPVSDELRWLAGVLGGMRDREVLLARLRAELAELPPELVLGPVAARLDSTLSRDMAKARRQALRELDGERYRALLDAVLVLAAAPPFTPVAAGPARAVLPPLVRKAHRRMLRDLDTAADAAEQEAREEALHDARKTAKRLRYAGEGLAPVFGADASRLARRAEALQEALGEHQDSVIARDVLRTMALAAHDAAENAFTYGLLVGVEQARSARAEAEVPRLRRRLTARKARRLLR